MKANQHHRNRRKMPSKDNGHMYHKTPTKNNPKKWLLKEARRTINHLKPQHQGRTTNNPYNNPDSKDQERKTRSSESQRLRVVCSRWRRLWRPRNSLGPRLSWKYSRFRDHTFVDVWKREANWAMLNHKKLLVYILIMKKNFFLKDMIMFFCFLSFVFSKKPKVSKASKTPRPSRSSEAPRG